MSSVEKKDEYGCTLFIDTLDDHPQILTNRLGLQASELIIKGSELRSPMTKKVINGKYNENNLWIYHIEKKYAEVGVYLNSPLEKLLDIMDEQKEVFIDILKKYPQNHILCYGYFYDVNPYFIFNKNLINKIGQYNIDIEFDIYCLNE